MLQLNDHYQCLDTIEISISVTGNLIDEETGGVVFGIGQGRIDVVSGD